MDADTAGGYSERKPVKPDMSTVASGPSLGCTSSKASTVVSEQVVGVGITSQTVVSSTLVTETIQPPKGLPPWTMARLRRQSKLELQDKVGGAEKLPVSLPAGSTSLNVQVGLPAFATLSSSEQDANKKEVGVN